MAVNAGDPFYTNGKISNTSGGIITLFDKKIWEGSQQSYFPEKIDHNGRDDFQHDAESGNCTTRGSVAGLQYKLADGIKWVVAWSNPQDKANKVYAEIVEQFPTWEQIKNNLDRNGTPDYPVKNNGYHAKLKIEKLSNKPTMTATIEPASTDDN